MVDQALFSSDRQDWNTPKEILEMIQRVNPIGLDPCSNGSSLVSAPVQWDRCSDGLAQPWSGLGLVFVNPPSGRAAKGEAGIIEWLAKCCYEAAHGVEVVALVPVRTDTRWFQEYGFTAQAVCFWRGRIRFVGGASCAPVPSAVLYWGPRA